MAAVDEAMYFAATETCKLHGVEPYGWLGGVLETIADHPIN